MKIDRDAFEDMMAAQDDVALAIASEIGQYSEIPEGPLGRIFLAYLHWRRTQERYLSLIHPITEEARNDAL